jgi:hypothetical protein
MTFLEALREQRWDDHRYYHHSRVNQSLHFLSALCFLTAYGLVAVDPVAAAVLGWFCAMVSRQIGHFFFEPKGYDEVNRATHEHKEAIKIGYNLTRKVVLLSVWALTPLLLLVEPSLFGLLEPHVDRAGWLRNLAVSWIAVAGGAIVVRMAQLVVTHDVRTSLVWGTKILTDPFHDVRLYHRAPLRLLRGEWLDPMVEVGLEQGPRRAAGGG